MGLQKVDDLSLLFHASLHFLKVDLIVKTSHIVRNVLAEIDFFLVYIDLILLLEHSSRRFLVPLS